MRNGVHSIHKELLLEPFAKVKKRVSPHEDGGPEVFEKTGFEAFAGMTDERNIAPSDEAWYFA
jgi:hypothetical protein